VFEPLELIEKLVALVPFPRSNQVRYSGVLAANARLRPQVVPGGVAAGSARAGSGAVCCPQPEEQPPAPPAGEGTAVPRRVRERRLSWAELMKRVFLEDVLECPRCQARMRLIATITDPGVIVAILSCLGLEARAPPQASAGPPVPPQARPVPRPPCPIDVS
jgi:hypothetical protein